MIYIEIPGEPTAKGRGRTGVNKHTGRTVVYTPKATRDAEAELRWYAAQNMAERDPIDGPLVLTVVAYRSKGMPGKSTAREGSKSRQQWDDACSGKLRPTAKPDADNYLKLASDACNGIVWRDDSQIVRATVEKAYSVRPRLVIVVESFEGEAPCV